MSKWQEEIKAKLLSLKEAIDEYIDVDNEAGISILQSIICEFLYENDKGLDYYPLIKALYCQSCEEDFHVAFKLLEKEGAVVWDKKKKGYVLSPRERDDQARLKKKNK